MKRTIFLNGRRRTLRALMVGAAVALLSVPVVQAEPGYNFDNKEEGDAAYLRNFEGTSWGDYLATKQVQVIPYLSQGIGVSAQPDLVGRILAEHARNNVATSREQIEGLLSLLPPEDVKAIEQGLSGGSATRSAYHRADDFAPPRNVAAPAATAAGVDWSETGMWIAVGLAGALGLLGAGILANRGRVRAAHS